MQVVLGNMTECDEVTMCKLVGEACTPELARFELGLCGRGFGDKVQIILKSLPRLCEAFPCLVDHRGVLISTIIQKIV